MDSKKVSYGISLLGKVGFAEAMWQVKTTEERRLKARATPPRLPPVPETTKTGLRVVK